MSAHGGSEVSTAPPARPVPDAAIRACMDALGLTAADATASALKQACEQGDLPRVWALLELGAEAIASLLHIVVAIPDHIALVELLVAYGADAKGWRCSMGRSLLHRAQSAAMVRALVAAGCAVDTRDNDGNTPLHLTVGAGAARALLAAGADPDALNHWGGTPLNCGTAPAHVLLAHAVEREGAAGALALLNARGAGTTPLVSAAARGARQMLRQHRRLCAHADWTAADRRRRTTLHLLAWASSKDDTLADHRALLAVLRALLAGERGAFADPALPAAKATAAAVRAACDAQIAALQPASAGDSMLEAERLRRECERDVADAEAVAWARAALDALGPHPNMAGVTLRGLLDARDTAGDMPLHTAARSGRASLLRALLEAYPA